MSRKSESLTPDNILDYAFPHPDLKQYNGPLVTDMLNDQIRPSGGGGMETAEEQIVLRKKLFGNAYFREYVGKTALK